MDSQTFIATLADLIKSGASSEAIAAAYATQQAADLAAWHAAQIAVNTETTQAQAAALAADAESIAESEKRAAYFKRLTPNQIANCGLSNGMTEDAVFAKCVALYPDV